MGPVCFHPILKRARWGGHRLGQLLQKSLGEHPDYAESWELSDHESGQSVVIGGEFNGWSLSRLVQEKNAALFGRHAGLRQFPLLLKFLDACDRLSLQVHPNDVQARTYRQGSNGKTEAWVIISAEPGARVFAGLKPHIDLFRFERHLRDGSIEDCLHSFEVSPGDCIFIPSGTVHAIGEGIVLAEIQQVSDLTFRLSDWGRLGSDGQPRELHLDESLICTDFDRGPVNPVVPKSLVSLRESPTARYETEELVACEYFHLHRHHGTTSFSLLEDNCFHALMVVQGCGTLLSGDQRCSLTLGQTLLLPAMSSDALLIPDGELVVLDAFLPRDTAWLALPETPEVEELDLALDL